MKAALRYEWLRLRTIRSTWLLTGIAAGLAATISLLIAFGISQALANDAMGPSDLSLAGQVVVSQASAYGPLGPPFLLPYVLVMIGIFAWGHEYRHGMIRATLTSVPSRTGVWIAKFLVVGIWVALTVLLSLTVCAGAGWLMLHDDGVGFATYDIWRTVLKCVAYTVVFVWVGMAVTSVLRNQTGAVVVMLVWPLVVENIIQVVFALVPQLRAAADWPRFLPFEAGKAMLSGRDVTVEMWGTPLTPSAGFVVFGAFAAVLMGLSFVLFTKRDA